MSYDYDNIQQYSDPKLVKMVIISLLFRLIFYDLRLAVLSHNPFAFNIWNIRVGINTSSVISCQMKYGKNFENERQYIYRNMPKP